MNIVICGAGEVGSHAAEVLSAAGHNITVVDRSASRIRKIEDTLDVRTLCGNCATAEVLRDAGCPQADLVVCATQTDEINLLSAALAKGVGARQTVVRVHHRAYFEQRGLDYGQHLGIDRFICPEFSAAVEIARLLRNPGAMAVEDFGRGQIEMQEFAVSPKAPALGLALAKLGLPGGTRVAAITRNGAMFIPEGASVIEPEDQIVLVGNTGVFASARKFFRESQLRRRKVVLMGGPPMAVWLCRALRGTAFSIRLFELRRERAEELAEKLEWVTVINADPCDRSVFEEENLAQVDAFVALLDDDEHNILGSAWAKSMGVAQAVAVVQRPDYLHLLPSVGIDRAISPRRVAVHEIDQFLARGALRRVASLAEGIVDVFSVVVGEKCKFLDRPLHAIKLTPDWMVAGIQRADSVRVPGAEDTIHAGDTLLVIGRSGRESRLKKIFAAG